MKFPKALLGSLLAFILLPLQAADHNEAPQVRIDPAADLNDLYAFMNPNDPSELILAATVVPDAGPGTQFSDAIEYRFNISNNASPAEQFSIVCTFAIAGQFSCALTGLDPLTGNVGEIVDGPDFRIFTGLRDDPFFFDSGAFGQTVATLQPQFTNPGINGFANQDILSIVIGINPDTLTNDGTTPVLGVYATTNRLSGATLNGSTTGSFFNTAQSGHGFFFEVIDVAGQAQVFVAWFVFDNNGNPIWLVGQGTIDGLTATVPVQGFEGAMFPPSFNPDDVIATDAGTLAFNFAGCNNAVVNFQSANEAELGSTALDLSRLTSISGLPCAMLQNGQVDRVGRPAINTALIDLLQSTGLKDAYNEAVDPATWFALFQAEMAANLAALDTLDGTPGNALLDANTLATVLVNDILLIDTSIAACDAYLAVELGVTTQCGGRTLERDVIDDTLGAVVGPGVSDGVANDSQFLTVFPFLGLPNATVRQ